MSRRPDDLDPLSPDLEEAFGRAVPTPDLTGSIMGRLGYMRAAPAAARRGRLRRWAARATTCLVGLAVIAVGLRVHDQGASARRPVGPTVPGAIGTQVTQQQQRFIRTLETLRDIAPAVPAPTEREPGGGFESIIEFDLEGAVGPIC